MHSGRSATLEPGDIYIAATDTEEPLDFRKGVRGACRILHCDHDFRVKAELWTGEIGLVVGLALAPDGSALYSSNPQKNSFACFDAAGNRIPGPDFLPTRRFGNMLFDPAGRFLVAVHSFHGEAIADQYGDGKLVRCDLDDGSFEFFDLEIDGGRGGKHCVSNLALAPDGRTLFYVSEAGRRVLRYDLEARRQLADFLVFDAEGKDGTYGLGVLNDGRVLMATGTGALLCDLEGRIMRRYDVPAIRGWTRARLAPDGRHFYLGNFLEGILQRREIETGAIVAAFDLGKKGSLTSVVEYAGPQQSFAA